jgi:hypothetical protein
MYNAIATHDVRGDTGFTQSFAIGLSLVTQGVERRAKYQSGGDADRSGARSGEASGSSRSFTSGWY